MEATDIAYMAGLFDGEGSVDYKQRIERKKKQQQKESKVVSIHQKCAYTPHLLKIFVSQSSFKV